VRGRLYRGELGGLRSRETDSAYGIPVPGHEVGDLECYDRSRHQEVSVRQWLLDSGGEGAERDTLCLEIGGLFAGTRGRL